VTSYEAPEPEIEFSDPFMMEEQIFTEGLADINPVQLSKSSRNNGREGRKADLTSFDRDKFYKRIGIDFNPTEEVQQEDEDCIMMVEVCTTEFGSVDLADNEEITIEKSFDYTPKLNADLNSFDREAFYRKQGVYDEPIEENLFIAERQMTTEEFETELADHIPVELTKNAILKQRERAPNLADRDAFYKRLGIDFNADK